MLTTNEFFDLVKHKHQIPSDYALAKRLKVSQASISLHRTKPHGMDDALALRVANELGMAPEYVLICAAAERAKRTEEKAVYTRLGVWIEMSLSSIPRAFPPALETVEARRPAAR